MLIKGVAAQDSSFGDISVVYVASPQRQDHVLNVAILLPLQQVSSRERKWYEQGMGSLSQM